MDQAIQRQTPHIRVSQVAPVQAAAGNDSRSRWGVLTGDSAESRTEWQACLLPKSLSSPEDACTRSPLIRSRSRSRMVLDEMTWRLQRLQLQRCTQFCDHPSLLCVDSRLSTRQVASTRRGMDLTHCPIGWHLRAHQLGSTSVAAIQHHHHSMQGQVHPSTAQQTTL